MNYLKKINCENLVTNMNSVLKFCINEIPMRKFSHQPKMNMWIFHVTIKNQIIYT
jgi:hypothetical protein